MNDRIRLRTGGGSLGTGVFLLGRRPAGGDAWDARRWVTLLFLPLVPLGASRFHGRSEGQAGETWEVERTPLETPTRGDVLQTYGAAAGLLLATVAPVAFAWWTIHQTGLLEALKVVIGASVPILVLMWRDIKTPRVVR